MTQQQGDYITKQEVDEGLALLQGEPAAIIEQPRPRMVLRNGLGEEWTVAWVKLSTAFKPHIKELRGAPLAVWLFLSLSINKQGVAFPSMATISNDTGYSRQGIMDAIKVLEDKGYLKVRRGERKFNLYEPEFAAIGRVNEPTESVNLVDQSGATSQVLPSDESSFSLDRSSTLYLNKRNKREQEKDDFSEIEKQANQKVDAILKLSSPKETEEKEACQMFEKALGFGELPWHSIGVWSKMARFVTAIYKSDRLAFGNYVVWRGGEGKFKAMSNKQIRMNPQVFMDTGWAEFEGQARPAAQVITKDEHGIPENY